MMVDVLNASTGMNNSTQKKFKQYVLSRKFNTGFPIHMMLKDLDNAVGIAHEHAMPAPFSQLCRDLWAAASTSLGPQVDHTALALFSEQLGGGEIK
jgi:3-hydroxyisobutyrate dehydrogenase